MTDKKSNAFWLGIGQALCLDLPHILDSAWRHREYDANRLFEYTIKDNPAGTEVKRRSYRRTPVFWLFLATLVFCVYGPTFDALCSVFGVRGMPVFRWIVGLGGVGFAVWLCWFTGRGGYRAACKRIESENTENLWRRVTVHSGVQAAVVGLCSPIGMLGFYHIKHAHDTGCQVLDNPHPAQLQIAVLGIAIALAVWLAGKKFLPWQRIALQAILLAIVGLVLWKWVALPDATEAGQGPYLHAFGVAAIVLAGIATLAPLVALWQFKSVDKTKLDAFKEQLKTTELFKKDRKNPDLSWRRAWSALTVGALNHPLHLLLMPAFFVLIVPTRWMEEACAGGLIAGAMLLMFGSLSTRWQQMVLYVRRWFFVGTPLVISLAVIVLAALRLWPVQYASTVLDAAPFGIIFMWLVMHYALLWWFEYSINSVASIALLHALSTDKEALEELVSYDIKSAAAMHAAAPDRFIAPHGAGRFAILGWFVNKKRERQHAFHSLDLMELFKELMPSGAEDVLHDLNRRVELYFLILNSTVVLGLSAFIYYYGHGDETNTVASVVSADTQPAAGATSDLAALLKAQAADKRPALLVAASGGGTRAALFTASTLEGLAKLKVAKDVVLLSGVSGGGAASAYFYSHQNSLLGQDPTDAADNPWRLYKERMTAPFIGDVLDGASEWRVASAQPLGVLLAESFERRLFADGLQRLGEATRPALILNTTITGHPQEDSIMLRNAFAPLGATENCDELHRPNAFLSGGRLIFTNLKSSEPFPNAGSVLPDVRYPYVVLRDANVRLASAAALNANFPPVFPNARVSMTVNDPKCSTRSYYVTDGGATENLGLVSALYALKSALQELKASPESIPEIHLVAIEASATGYDYSQDRGLGAAAGSAKERLVGGLTEYLLRDVCEQIGEPGCVGPKLQVHYISLPLTFRSRGGFGTHWMFPNTIEIANPHVATLPSTLEKWRQELFEGQHSSVLIDKEALLTLWNALHEKDAKFCESKFSDDNSQIVADWICGTGEAAKLEPDLHVTEWAKLTQALRSKQP